MTHDEFDASIGHVVRVRGPVGDTYGIAKRTDGDMGVVTYMTGVSIERDEHGTTECYRMRELIADLELITDLSLEPWQKQIIERVFTDSKPLPQHAIRWLTGR